MPRHLQPGRAFIPESTKPARIAENPDVFDFRLTARQIAEIDALDTGMRSGPEPDSIALEKLPARDSGSLTRPPAA